MFKKIFILLSLLIILSSCSGNKKLKYLESENIIFYSYHDNRDLIPIMGSGRISKVKLIKYFRTRNGQISNDKVNKIFNVYISECINEGINHDVAFAQMFHETNYLKYTGDVEAYQNNFAGIGATGSKNPGNSFPTIEMGVRAHIQHLKAYASKSNLKNKIVDPRYKLVKHGCAPYLKDLTGRWAMDKKYDIKIKNIIRKINTKK